MIPKTAEALMKLAEDKEKKHSVLGTAAVLGLVGGYRPWLYRQPASSIAARAGAGAAIGAGLAAGLNDEDTRDATRMGANLGASVGLASGTVNLEKVAPFVKAMWKNTHGAAKLLPASVVAATLLGPASGGYIAGGGIAGGGAQAYKWLKNKVAGPEPQDAIEKKAADAAPAAKPSMLDRAKNYLRDVTVNYGNAMNDVDRTIRVRGAQIDHARGFMRTVAKRYKNRYSGDELHEKLRSFKTDPYIQNYVEYLKSDTADLNAAKRQKAFLRGGRIAGAVGLTGLGLLGAKKGYDWLTSD